VLRPPQYLRFCAMRPRRALCGAITACSLLLTPGSVLGQIVSPGQLELGLLGTYTKYDDQTVGLSSEFGAGGRLGLFLTHYFSVEARGDFTQAEQQTTGRNVDLTRLGGTLYFYAPKIGFGKFYLGAGYTHSEYRGAMETGDDGGHLILGNVASLGGRAALRVEGRLDYLPSSKLVAPNESALNLGAAMGLSVFAFGGSPRDSDRDGVPNTTDECPGTPYGALVDGAGCPLDGDGDLVFDGLDSCPGTPAGAIVDPAGCPSDADGDSVVDGVDVCPNTPAGALVDANGCPTDADEDGVFDGLDQCPDTPRGATVDVNGCSSDGDGDGVLDGLDQCPGTPTGVAVNAAGCPTDADGDGVPDGIDRCPNTPAGRQVDALGCAIVTDADGDGVPDSIDRCPDTRAGQRVDSIGCPILFVVERGEVQPLILRGVNFEVGRSALTRESYVILDEVAASLLAHSDVRVEIAGHTDITGSRALNSRLSRERAQAVEIYLAQKGVDPSRMVSRGYGPDEPIATNATAAGRAQNRRVELRRLEGGTP